MTLLVIQHVPHERLGTFEPIFMQSGLTIRTLNAADTQAIWPKPDDANGIVSMGGPQSVYEQRKYPWIKKELAFLEEAIAAKRPILGVCLGAQMLAAALGAKVTKNPQKEIGWYPLMREPGADGDPMWDIFGQTETVFQWHGDTFALPKGAVQLASSPLCAQQAFRYGDNAYGVQFHVEVTEAIIRAWMRVPGNRAELASLRGTIDPMTIRRQSPQHINRLQVLGHHVATTFAHHARSH
ncbi:MAG: gamma-glutamyl-gamma-aminobutyrate hydrolase family protein [Candidatus Omnitrophica bacterium]|nr:gamma-glutamyl-gamma-aminobutyrate hydrolase family protein [Candidatus Omnitrophota bacterium]